MKGLIIFAIIPFILTIGITPALQFDFIQEAEALKSKGTPSMRYGSATAGIVCGDRFCSEGSHLIISALQKEKNLMTKEKNILSSESELLPSWNEGKTKQKIIEFVNKVSNPSSSTFVPASDRIATFDNDGTLWIEQPLYIPFAFHLKYLYEKIESEPNLASVSPFSELLEKQGSIVNEDLESIPGLSEVLLPAYPNISQEDYVQKSKNFLDNTIHPRYNIPLKQLTYQPMVELVKYLQQNNFTVYIVSAGFQGLMRSVSEDIYNIDKENVIGSHPEFIYQLTEQGPALIRQSTLASFNDGAEKPVNIQKHIGKIPIFSCGNSGGDIEMLTLTHHHEYHFACMLDHDDEKREYFYPNHEALEASKKNGWIIISMKNDFETIFSNSDDVISFSKEKIINNECSFDFWANNLELWEKLGVDYNADFDQTFGKDYFVPDITLLQAIKKEGVGLDKLAREGTLAYLNALADPQMDEEKVRLAVHFGYVPQIEKYNDNC